MCTSLRLPKGFTHIKCVLYLDKCVQILKKPICKKRICEEAVSVGGAGGERAPVKKQPVRRKPGVGGGAVKRALYVKKEKIFVACRELVY